MEQQFESFRQQLDESVVVREQLRSIVSDLDSAIRLMHAALLPLYHHSSIEAIHKAKGHISEFQRLYTKLGEVLKSCPGEYYRYHDHWRNQTQQVIFLLSFVNWLEFGNLLSHGEVESLLDLQQKEFFVDLEDYLIGLCNMSNELPRYVVNQVTAGIYDCPKRVSLFLSDLYAAFRILNLRNDFLRKRFDGIKYDLKKVEEVLYDVQIRGLLNTSSQLASTVQPSTDELMQLQ
ncbi:hypothetical protein O6H91_22G038200 [Diphasiastrum complanatum]|uniref:Uncharacterized protein n=2 Tax=Diphasiastrum complanatum TaxID=34168 RepID=A0ACC2AGF5_DIPCM|nr:hypothetical protein O6H91_22G037800 [Diphasiastrum complanatum]KAJ7516005.1 hypothetical protein O6H91_22G038200 [Diphasiastrum complanatum]